MTDWCWEELDCVNCQECVADAYAQSYSDIECHYYYFAKPVVWTKWAYEKIEDMDNAGDYQ